MKLLRRLAQSLDIRPGEGRVLLLSTGGSFLVMGFMVAARALREAFFLDEFSVEALPYVVMATAVANVPSVIAFTRRLARRSAQRIYSTLIVLEGAGLALLFAVTTWLPDSVVATTTVAFFVWTAVGSLLLASGFWVLTSEHFPLRDAKRLYGMISAGGTFGAMVAGLSLGPLAARVGNQGLVVALMLTLAAAWLVQRALPAQPRGSSDVVTAPIAPGENLALLARSSHLRNIAAIVAVATMASFLLDYQFKEAVAARYPEDEQLAGFLGVFYGLSGMAALLVQVAVASRLLAAAGVARSLAVLPVFLIGGGALLLVAPGLLAATLVRGTDNTLRKSLHRSVVEYLFVPVPSLLRRRTKSLIDSLVDNGAEGIAALFVSLWVIAGWPSRGLAAPVIVLGCLFLWLARRMGARYLQTLLDRLKEGREALDDEDLPADLVTGELTVTMTRFDLRTVLENSGLAERRQAPRARRRPPAVSSSAPPDEDDATVVLVAQGEPGPGDVPALLRLLARDTLVAQATAALGRLAPGGLNELVAVLLDEDADFVIRRRIPGVLGIVEDHRADDALLQALCARRFEVRYRAGVALARRRNRGLPRSPGWEDRVWKAIHEEAGRDRPIWELQRLLDDRPARDELVTDRVYGRGELSLEHTFRLLSLVLDPEPIRTAFFGIILDEERLRSIALEYLEQVLPAEIRRKLWPFIGDISEHQRKREIRHVDDVVADLLKTGATLFAGADAQARLREALEEHERPTAEPDS